MTDQEIQAIFDKYIGKAVEAEDPSNLDQCFDWAFKYCDEIGIPREAIRHFNAYEIFTKPNDLTLQYFDYIPNTPNGTPPMGAIVVFGIGVGPAGHVSVCQKSDTNSLTSTDQNWNGHKYVEYIIHPYDNVLGWLVPKQQGMVTIPQKELDQIRADRDSNYNNWQEQLKQTEGLKTQLQTLQTKYDEYVKSHPDPVEPGNPSPTVPTPPTPPINPPNSGQIDPFTAFLRWILSWFKK